MSRARNSKQVRESFLFAIKWIAPLYLITASAMTQYFAYRTKYPKVLGGWTLPKTLQASLHIRKIYFPLSYWKWKREYLTEVPKLIETIDKWFLVWYLTILGLFILILRKRQEVTVHGTARWANRSEIKKMDLANDTGLVLGKDGDGNILRDNGDKHTIMAAPTRGGKGINTVTPTALDWVKSIVFNDIKGELWDLTAGYRKEVLKQKVFMFCPVDTTGVSCAYNALDYVSIGTLHEYEDVGVISQTLIDTEGKGESDHWISSAINLLNGVILHVKYAKPNASLTDVIQFLTPTDMSLVDQIADILGVPREDESDERGNCL